MQLSENVWRHTLSETSISALPAYAAFRERMSLHIVRNFNLGTSCICSFQRTYGATHCQKLQSRHFLHMQLSENVCRCTLSETSISALPAYAAFRERMAPHIVRNFNLGTSCICSFQRTYVATHCQKLQYLHFLHMQLSENVCRHTL